MTYDDKPKRKNLSPDELLQQAKLLHPENEAFLRGETKNLPHRAELLANLYLQAGFPISDDNLRSTHRSRVWDFGFVLLACVMFLCSGVFYLYAVLLNYKAHFQSWHVCVGIIMLPLALLLTFIGLGAIVSLWKMATTSEKEINRRIASLAKEGKLIIGTWSPTDGRLVIGSSVNHKSKSFALGYISPKNGKMRKMSWHSMQYRSVQKGDNLILFYLNDKCVIVL